MSFCVQSRFRALKALPHRPSLQTPLLMQTPMAFGGASANLYPNLSLASAPPAEHHSMHIDPRSQHILVCYLPDIPDDDEGVISCTLKRKGEKLVFTTDNRAAMIPEGAIIDSVEFFGINGFITKEVFSIGLGQLNTDISFPLVQDTNSTIANESVGGCRDFLSYDRDGKNIRNIVICNSNINVDLGAPVIHGELQIVVKYHMKVV